MGRRATLGRGEAWLEFSLRAVVVVAVLASILSARQGSAQAREAVLNLYSARHYQTDEALYANFTKQTGVKINRIELNDDALLQRLKSEGANSPADVVLLVDAARLWRAQQDGLFQPIQSKVLNERIPANLRADDGSWYGFSTRARVIVYDKAKLKPEDVDTYEKLADPKLKGMVCTRSGSHPYMLSLIAAMIERNGEAATEKWARGVVANMARDPKGGDTDQIRAVAAGECAVALTNSYYWVRLLRSADPKDKEVVAKVGYLWPNQATSGTHINVSGGAVARHAPNRDHAIRFLEYLASPEAQAYFANGNNEWPVVKGVNLDNPALAALGSFKAETVPVSAIGRSTAAAQRLLDRVGYR
ncbi:MAG: Fe(3+) ABC transporter substrate-binding protein [Sutterellaceae bacterium]|nr:Fe(3+) ABC transporter substrate-binding protein [Burkholderiaceae bacterium]MCX7901695.1 Fe(3+) ABC transporter substrate-binding protein [Burkholderiaceae bacterium]MDW8429102.1 Fe(3+) ABC transporter substrate-binding protein [Sutterellaceae bacterium]